jgi:hypothetical protein
VLASAHTVRHRRDLSNPAIRLVVTPGSG